MTFSEAKELQLIDYLRFNGHTPVRIAYGNAWFLSPLRQEKTPSFKVNLHKNVWFDFGAGEGGNIIDLVKRIKRVNAKEALGLIGNNSISVNRQIIKGAGEEGQIKINRIQEIENPALVQYLRFRKVSFSFARNYLKEAYYTVHDRRYYALAFKNDKGGYELRNAKFKSGTSPKFITTIVGTDSSMLNVFEGFMDFLSCCSFYNRLPKAETIILNSLSFLPKSECQLKQAKNINLFLDNDQAGRAAVRKVISVGGNVKDWSQILYPDHKDFNEFLKG